VAPDVIEAFVKNAAVDGAVEAFVKDFEELWGSRKNHGRCVDFYQKRSSRT
jgi:hypothetical protein